MTLSKYGLCLIIALSTTVAMAWCDAGYQSRRAQELMSLLSQVKPGVTPHSTVQALISSYSANSTYSNAHAECHPLGVSQFSFSNRWLKSLHLAPARFIWITVEYCNGIAVLKSFTFAEEPRSAGSVTEAAGVFDLPTITADPSGRQVNPIEAISQERNNIHVFDGGAVPQAQQQADWQVDASCLSTFGACKSPRAILAGAFPFSATHGKK